LPLQIETGNAIVDYLLNGRPKSDLPYIFLCDGSPLRPLSNYTVSQIVTAHMKRANVAKNKRRGSHSFRRSFGRKLLEAETSLDLVNELLGHKRLNSSKPYLPSNEQELKLCALSLNSIGKVGNDV
jgi:site-specific recombinase XerD